MFSQKSVLMSGTSFIIRTGNSSMNLRRTVLFEERIIYKKKKIVPKIEIQIRFQSLARISNESKFILGLIPACL